MFGLIIILAAILIARSINTRAMTLMTIEQQFLFQESFRKRSWINLSVIAVQLVGYYCALRFTELNPKFIMSVLFSSVLAWIAIQAHLSYNAFQKLDLPQKVIHLYLLSTLVRITAIIAYVIWATERI